MPDLYKHDEGSKVYSASLFVSGVAAALVPAAIIADSSTDIEMISLIPPSYEIAIRPAGIPVVNYSLISLTTIDNAYKPKSEFAKRLAAIREKAISEGLELLDYDGIEREINLRRGESI